MFSCLVFLFFCFFVVFFFFFFQAEDGIRDKLVTGVQTCALPIYPWHIHCMFLVIAAGKIGSMQAVGQSIFKQTAGPLIEMMGVSPPTIPVNWTKQLTWRVRPLWSPTGSAFVSLSLDEFTAKIWPAPDKQFPISANVFALD